jgi:hypothetical protein
MTRCQELEMRRVTKQMWALLRYAKQMDPQPADVSAPLLRTARILKQRGFLVVAPEGGGYYAGRLTEAGHEAVARRRR